MRRLAFVLLLICSSLYPLHTLYAQPRDNLGLCLYPSVSAVSYGSLPNSSYFKLVPKGTLQAGINYSYFLNEHLYVNTGLTAGWRNFGIRQVRFDDPLLAGNNSITVTPILASLNAFMQVGYYYKGFSIGIGPSLTFVRYRNRANTINRITTAPQGVTDNLYYLTFSENDYTLFGLNAGINYTWKNQNGRWFSVGVKADVPVNRSPDMQFESHILGHIYNTEFQPRQELFAISLVRYFGLEPSAKTAAPVPADE